MKMKLYSIKDRATGAFMTPWPAHQDAHAIRMFQDNVNDPNSACNKHPDDYDLWFVGYFDDDTGKLQKGQDFGGPNDHQETPFQIFLGKNCIIKEA